MPLGRIQKHFYRGNYSIAANQAIKPDYTLVRNATGYCFVTRLGTFSTMHPHHRQWVADDIVEPVPGLLAGGPNAAMQHKCHHDFTEPKTAYTDVDCSYASNEIAIN